MNYYESHDKCIIFNLRKYYCLFLRYCNKKIKDSGINCFQYYILLFLRDNRKIFLSKMCSEIGIDRTTLSRNIYLLEENGFIKDYSNKSKKSLRENSFSISQKGIEALKISEPIIGQINEQCKKIFLKKFDETLHNLKQFQLIGDFNAIKK